MITFGTDGWRGIISEDYTFNNVRLVAEAIAGYIKDRGEAEEGIVVGYDARFLSGEYAQDCAAVLASHGIKTYLGDAFLPTPALTWQVVDRKTAGGIMITASHNPAAYNGLKFKATYGGSASPEIIAEIEKYVRALETSGRDFPKVAFSEKIEKFAPQDAYLAHVKALLNKDLLASYKGKVVFDVMHGSAQGYTEYLAKEYGLDLIEIRGEYNPSFGGTNPEPIEKNLLPLKEAVAKYKADVGLATDGDGDRIGAIDPDGRFISANQIMALLIKYFVEKRGWSGGVVKTITVSELVTKTAQKYGLTVHETPVGFKYVANLMITDDILIGGEESGGIGLKNYIPERDGVMLAYLLIEIVAAYKKTLGQILDEMMDELGYFHYQREDLHIENERKTRLMTKLTQNPPTEFNGEKVIKTDVRDGCKLYLNDGWLIFRASGTEPIVRIYTEFPTVERMTEIMQKAITYAQNA
jgi:phosphomannomutase